MKNIKQTPAHDLINQELMAMIPPETRKIVDIGCMHGQMARVYKAINSAVNYVGVDVDVDYAKVAAQYCDQVLAEDVEKISDEAFSSFFPSDCWIFGDTLEHLRDPWRVMRKIREEIDADGCVLVCIPNAQHWGVQLRLLSGHFYYEDSGLLDRTHLRWFTRATMLSMFEQTGWSVITGLTRTLPESPEQASALAGIRIAALSNGIDPHQLWKMPYHFNTCLN